MEPQTLIQDLTGRGISLTTDGEHVVVRPASKLTDADRALIRHHKTALLELLRAPEPQPEGTIDESVRAEITAIEAAAMLLGWPRLRLWAVKFWPVRGLAAVLDPGDRICELTEDWIQIQKRDASRQRFYRLDS